MVGFTIFVFALTGFAISAVLWQQTESRISVILILAFKTGATIGALVAVLILMLLSHFYPINLF